MLGPTQSAIVIGGGIAGLACAGVLARAGVAVTVMDKGRRPGGRVATRRADGAMFNHGAQFATARGPAFAAVLAALQAAGVAAPWPAAGGRRFSFLPGMSALPAALADRAAEAGATLLLDRQAAFLHGAAVRHMAASDIKPGVTIDEGGEVTAPFDAVLVALPSPQAASLLRTAGHAFADVAAGVDTAPCWTVMARFPGPIGGPDVLEKQGAVAWAAREGSRPGYAGAECWTIQASVDWSRAHLERPPEEAAAMLLAAFQAITDAPTPDLLQAHRWRFAQVQSPAGPACLWDAAAGLGACGDWCLGGKIEAAFDSGEALARAVLGVS